MKIHKHVKSAGAVLTGFALTMTLSSGAMAAKNAAETAEYWGSQIDSFMKLALQFGFFAGVILFVLGLWLLYKDSKQPGQDHAKKGFISLAVGCALLIAPTLIDIGASSIVEGEEANSNFVAPSGFE